MKGPIDPSLSSSLMLITVILCANFSAARAATNSPSQYQNRQVELVSRLDPLFAVAVAAIGAIDLNGKNVTTDSFDSVDPNFSENGLYPVNTPGKRKSNGDICSASTIINSIEVGNATIHGKAKTGPNGTVAVGKNGQVTGGISDDFNVDFPSVAVPIATWMPPPVGGTVGSYAYANIFATSGDYAMTGLSGSIYIGTNVHVRIKMTGNVKMAGNNDQIRIAPGGSCKFYMVGASFSVKGQGLVNEDGAAGSFYYYGASSNTSVDFGGNANFTGAIYAPNADLTLGGGGSSSYNFIGAAVVKTITMNGHYNIHYDENIRRIGPCRGFVPTCWREL